MARTSSVTRVDYQADIEGKWYFFAATGNNSPIVQSSKPYASKRSALRAGKSVFPDAKHFVEVSGTWVPA